MRRQRARRHARWNREEPERRNADNAGGDRNEDQSTNHRQPLLVGASLIQEIKSRRDAVATASGILCVLSLRKPIVLVAIVTGLAHGGYRRFQAIDRLLGLGAIVGNGLGEF